MTYEGEYNALFCGDEEGGVLIQCDHCKEEYVDKTKWGEQSVCPHCEKTLRYPAGANW